jgi:heterodisulfide reductase subunit A
MVGMEPASGARSVAEMLKIPVGHDGFFNATNELLEANCSGTPGVFLAGTCTGPKTIPETIADARAAATAADAYLRKKS